MSLDPDVLVMSEPAVEPLAVLPQPMVIEGPTLDLNFLVPPLDPRITFTRASTATYFDQSGTMHTAATDAPRFDYDPVTHGLRGLLIEEARTNIWLQSADASNAAWSATSGGGPVAPVVTGNQTTAPDGTLTAARVVYPAVSVANSYSVVFQAITTAASVYMFSVWLKGSVGGEQINVGQLSFTATRATLTTQWQRFTYVTQTESAGTNYLMIGTDLRGGQSSTLAQTIYVWGAQVEVGAFPTSYIPTTVAAVTRAQDVCSVPVAAWYNTTQGSLSFEYIVEGVDNTGYATPLALVGANPNTDFIFTDQIAGGFGTPTVPQITACGSVGIAGTVVSTATFAANISTSAAAVQKCATSWSTAVGIMGAHNGQLTAGQGAVPGPLPVITGLSIAGIAHYQPQFDLWARRVSYRPRALSNAELQQLTTSQPMGVGILKVQKQRYRDWIATGGAPPIYT